MIITAEVRKATIKNLNREIVLTEAAPWPLIDRPYAALLREDREIIRAIKPGEDVINPDALEIIEAYGTNG